MDMSPVDTVLSAVFQFSSFPLPTARMKLKYRVPLLTLQPKSFLHLFRTYLELGAASYPCERQRGNHKLYQPLLPLTEIWVGNVCTEMPVSSIFPKIAYKLPHHYLYWLIWLLIKFVYLFFKFFQIYILICICVSAHICYCVNGRSKDNLWGLGFSFHHVGPGH